MLASHGTTDIHDILVEPHTFLPAPLLLEHHRKVFYIPTIGLWTEKVDDDGRRPAFFWARDQLLAVWAQACLDALAGQETYDRTKRSRLYDPVHDVWAENMLPDADSYRANPSVHAELVATLVELELDLGTGRARYERLRDESFGRSFDWPGDRNQHGTESPQEPTATERLLAAIIELRLDLGHGEELFEALKQRSWHDGTRGQWRNPRSDQRTSYTQLLGVLGDWMIDRSTGREHYHALLNTPFYDARLNEWRHAMHPTRGVTDNRYAMAQLLDVVIRARLNEDGSMLEMRGALPSRLQLI